MLIHRLDNLDRFFVSKKENQRHILFGIEYFLIDYPQSGLKLFVDQPQSKACVHSDLLMVEYILLYLSHPHVEQLIKAGFAGLLVDFLVNVIRDERTTDGIKKRVDYFEEYFMEGNDISAITGLKRKQWHLLLKYAGTYKSWINYSEYIQINELTDRYLEKMLRLDRCYGRLIYDIEPLLAFRD